MVDMEHSNKQMKPDSTDEINFEMRRSFSWDRAFFTNDGFLDDEELSSMIEGGSDDVKHELQKIEEIESLEAKLFEEIEVSSKKSTAASKASSSSINSSSGKKDSQAKKVRATVTGSSSSSTPIRTEKPTRSIPLCGGNGGSVGNKAKSPARRSMSSKTGKARPDSPSKASAGITKKNKVVPVTARMSRTQPASPVSSGSLSSTISGNPRSKRGSSVPRRSTVNSENKVVPLNTRMSRTTPASPVSSGSSSSTFSVNQRSERGSSVPRRSTVNSEKPSASDERRNDEWKTSKPAVRLIPKTQSSVSLKVKPPPVISNPSPGLFNSSSSTDQKSKSIGNKGFTVHHRSKSTLKNMPTSQTPDRNGKQPAALHPGTRSPNASKTRQLSAPKTVAAVNTGLRPISQKTTTPKPSKTQPSAKAKSSGRVSRGAEDIFLVSPEVMDIKGKLNALKMEINMQKKERCKEIKTSRNGAGKGESSSIIQVNNLKK